MPRATVIATTELRTFQVEDSAGSTEPFWIGENVDIVESKQCKSPACAFQDQITKKDLLMVNRNPILGTFENTTLEKAFIVHNSRTVFLSAVSPSTYPSCTAVRMTNYPSVDICDCRCICSAQQIHVSGFGTGGGVCLVACSRLHSLL